MTPAVTRSSASSVQRAFGWRGSCDGMPFPRWVASVAPASTAARSWSVVAWVCPSETPTPRLRIRRICSGASAVCGDTVTTPTRSWRCAQRATSSASRGRTSAGSCTPRAPSWSEMNGPSTCTKGTAAATLGSAARAAATWPRAWWTRSSVVVTTVGTQVVTPTPARASVIPMTVSAETSGSLRSRPRNPLTCRSTSPAARTGSPSGGIVVCSVSVVTSLIVSPRQRTSTTASRVGSQPRSEVLTGGGPGPRTGR